MPANGRWDLIRRLKVNTVFQTLNAWFKQNLLSLNLAKTHFIKFISKNNNQHEMDTDYYDKSVSTITCATFLGLAVNCSLTWTNHFDLLTKKTKQYMLSNLQY